MFAVRSQPKIVCCPPLHYLLLTQTCYASSGKTDICYTFVVRNIPDRSVSSTLSHATGQAGHRLARHQLQRNETYKRLNDTAGQMGLSRNRPVTLARLAAVPVSGQWSVTSAELITVKELSMPWPGFSRCPELNCWSVNELKQAVDRVRNVHSYKVVSSN